MTIRWGILGCGDVTEVKSGPALQRARGSQLVAVMRRHGELAADYARRHSVPTWYDDAAALIHDPQVDAVYIAAPPGEHERLAMAVCAAGKPAYVEKPMARNHAECARMVLAFERARLPLFVAYYRRGLDRFLKARELVVSGSLGVITGVTYRYAAPSHQSLSMGAALGEPAALPWRLQAAHAGGGLFLDLGCHTLDILDFVLSPLEDVQGHAANRVTPHAVEDSVAMSFRTSSGALGTAHWNFASATRVDELVITGSDAELRLSTFGNEPLELHRGGALVERFELPNPAHIQQPLIQTIVDELSGTGSCPSTGMSAARTSAVMDAVLMSYYGTRADGFWELPQQWPGRRELG